ncbi:MAG: hypothetical protein AAFN00_19200, partial [Cyanobacteria bacterium J06558_2]
EILFLNQIRELHEDRQPPIITDFTSGVDEIIVSGVDDPHEVPVFDSETGFLFVDNHRVAQLQNVGLLGPEDVELTGNDLPVSNLNTSNTTVFRFFDQTAGGHFYTVDENERDFVLENLPNYDFEGETYNAVDPNVALGAEEVYRFFNSQTGVHLYTTSEVERDSIIENLDNFSYEGAKFFAYESEVEGSLPIFRFFEPTLGVHFYTPSEVERDFVLENLDNYDFEGVAYYALPVDS